MGNSNYKLALFGLSLTFAGNGVAADEVTAADLIELDFDDLVNLEVRIESAGKSAKRALDLAYAGYVITSEEIRASGVQTIPDALRLAPGVEIGQISAAEWSSGIRGGGGRYSRYVLVMVDGRIAYNNAFSGVNWDELNINMAQIERIEVIRGPNGSTWGANAVNGIIHIITQPPTADQKRVASVTAGGQGHASVAGMWSTSLGEQWRLGLSANASQWDGLPDQSGERRDGDHSDMRLSLSAYREWDKEETYITADFGVADQAPEIGYFDDQALSRDYAPSEEDKLFFTVQAQHTYHWSENGYWKLRGSQERVERDTWAFQWDSTNYQFEAEFGNKLGIQQFVGGLYGRYTDSLVELIEESGGSFEPNRRTMVNYGLYLSNTISFGEAFELTGGVRYDESDLGGSNIHPSLRGIWKVNDTNRLWAAVSRAAVTPARSLTDVANVPIQIIPPEQAQAPFPVVLYLNGAENVEDSSQLLAKELGYRKTFGNYSVDVALFVYDYTDEIGAATLGEPVPVFNEFMMPVYLRQDLVITSDTSFSSQGGEVVFRGHPKENWNTQFMLSVVDQQDASKASTTTATYINTWDIKDDLTWNVALRYSHSGTTTFGDLTSDSDIAARGDDYLVVDSALQWDINDRWRLDLIGRNLGKKHSEAVREEFTSPILVVEPNAMIKLNYRY